MADHSKFWKPFFGSSFVIFFNTLKAFVINKLLAIFLTPSLYASVGQFMNMKTIGEASSSLAMQNGWVSLTAKNKNDLNILHGVWYGGFRIAIIASVITCILAVVFCFTFPLELLFKDIPVRHIQAAIIFAIPGIFATNIIAICSSVMNGLGRFPSYAKINVISAVWQMAWVALFLYTGKLSVLLIIATESIIASLFALIIASKAGFSFNAIKHTVLDIRKPWVSFALMGLVPMILTPLVLTLVRSFIGLKLGFDAAGIWQGIWKISDFFASIFSAIIGVILLPKISSSLTKEKFNEIFYPTFLKFIAIVTGIILCVFIFRSQVILLMLSNKYIGAADYIPYQLIGDFFRSISWCFGFVLMAKLKTKSFIAIETFSQLFFAIATYLGILFFGFYGPMFAYAIENFVSLILLFVAFKGIKWNSL